MQLRAVLVLQGPGLKFKNNKYLLSNGANIVGNDPKCQVYINNKNFPQDYVANILLTEDFMYIESLCDNMVQFKSNRQVESSGQQKEVYKYIDKNCRYILQMEKIFYIGPYKAIVQVVQASHQLKLIRNIVDMKNVQTDDKQTSVDYQGEKLERNNSRSYKKEVDDEMNATRYETEKIQYENDDASALTTEIDVLTIEIDTEGSNVYWPTLSLKDERPYFEKKNSQSNNLFNIHLNQPKSQTKSLSRSPLIEIPLHHEIIHPNSQQSNTKSAMKKPKPNTQISNQLMFSGQKENKISNISMFSRQKENKNHSSSQQILYETVKKEKINLNKLKNNPESPEKNDIEMLPTTKNRHQERKSHQYIDDDIEMPPTIKDDQMHPFQYIDGHFDDIEMPPTIKDDQMHPFQYIDGHFDDIEMPPTIKDDQMHPFQYIDGHFDEAQTPKNHLYKSEKTNNTSDQYDSISWAHIQWSKEQNYDDRDKKKAKVKKQLLCATKFINQFHKDVFLPVDLEKPLGEKKIISSFAKRKLFKDDDRILVNLSGFKPQRKDKWVIISRGYKIVSDGKSEEYELLIFGKNSEASQKLLMGILLDKQIVTEDWLKDDKWQQKKGSRVQGTIQGISWEIVDKQRGKKYIFTNSGMFYFTETLKQLGRVFEYAGGSRTDELNKSNEISCVIDCGVDKDEEFYEKNKNCENWKFYSHKIVGQSILLGEVPFQKYIVDERSF